MAVARRRGRTVSWAKGRAIPEVAVEFTSRADLPPKIPWERIFFISPRPVSFPKKSSQPVLDFQRVFARGLHRWWYAFPANSAARRFSMVQVHWLRIIWAWGHFQAHSRQCSLLGQYARRWIWIWRDLACWHACEVRNKSWYEYLELERYQRRQIWAQFGCTVKLLMRHRAWLAVDFHWVVFNYPGEPILEILFS